MLENVKCGSHQKNGMSLGPKKHQIRHLKKDVQIGKTPPLPHVRIFLLFRYPPPPLLCGRPLCMAP